MSTQQTRRGNDGQIPIICKPFIGVLDDKIKWQRPDKAAGFSAYIASCVANPRSLALAFAAERKSMPTLLNRTKDNPWKLKTPPGTSEYTMHVDEKDGKKILVCTVGSTVLHYDARCIDDLNAMLKKAGDWVELGAADEQKPAKDGTVEGWGRSEANPVGGWYGLKKGLRGRFGVYIPPLLEELGLCELEHNARSNRMRAR